VRLNSDTVRTRRGGAAGPVSNSEVEDGKNDTEEVLSGKKYLNDSRPQRALDFAFTMWFIHSRHKNEINGCSRTGTCPENRCNTVILLRKLSGINFNRRRNFLYRAPT
jgi:hypothetical protein